MTSFIEPIIEALPSLLLGARVTLGLALISGFLGLLLGSLLGVARLSSFKPLSWATRAYIEFFRGTPLLVQLFIVYFGIPSSLQGLGINFRLTQWTAAIIALSLNAAAYIAEIMRGGIQSIAVGQREASETLGLSQFQAMRYIIFPQALRRMIPPLGNEFIVLLKETSIASVIGLEEMFLKGSLFVARTYQAFEIYVGVALIYLLMTLILSYLLSRVEIWMDPTRSRKPLQPEPQA